MRSELLVMIACGVLAVGCDNSSQRSADGERADSLYRAAMGDYTAGRLDKSIDGFVKVLKANPGNASARFQLACLLQDHRRDYLGAICNYRDYAMLSPDGDKAKIAGDRAADCERRLAEDLIRKHSLGGSVEQADTILKLQQELAAQQVKLANGEKAMRELRDARDALVRENERLRRMTGSYGEDEAAMVGVPARVVTPKAKPEIPSESELLDDEGESVDRERMASDIERLMAEESAENAPAPFGKTVKSVVKPSAGGARLEPPHEKRPKTYVVQEGDTLMNLAIRFYGRKSEWQRIREANKVFVPVDGSIKAGQELRLP